MTGSVLIERFGASPWTERKGLGHLRDYTSFKAQSEDGNNESPIPHSLKDCEKNTEDRNPWGKPQKIKHAATSLIASSLKRSIA